MDVSYLFLNFTIVGHTNASIRSLTNLYFRATLSIDSFFPEHGVEKNIPNDFL